MDAISSTAITAIDGGLNQVISAEGVVAQSVSGTRADIAVATAMIEALQSRLAVEESAQALSAEGQTLGTLIDAFA